MSPHKFMKSDFTKWKWKMSDYSGLNSQISGAASRNKVKIKQQVVIISTRGILPGEVIDESNSEKWILVNKVN